MRCHRHTYLATLAAVSIHRRRASLWRSRARGPGIDWPQFRGINASGTADGFALPEQWNVAAGENVRSTAAVPGLSHSSPIVRLWPVGGRGSFQAESKGTLASLKRQAG
jgi:hypothetical protein